MNSVKEKMERLCLFTLTHCLKAACHFVFVVMFFQYFSFDGWSNGDIYKFLAQQMTFLKDRH